MKIKFILAVLVASFALISSQSYAQSSGNVKIKSVWAGGYDDNGESAYRIKLTSNHPNPGNCSRADIVVMKKSHPEFAEWYAAVLAAQARGATISFWLSGCTSDRLFAKFIRIAIN